MSAARIAELQIKLAARDKKPGFKRNVIHIRQEIGRLKKAQANG